MKNVFEYLMLFGLFIFLMGGILSLAEKDVRLQEEEEDTILENCVKTDLRYRRHGRDGIIYDCSTYLAP